MCTRITYIVNSLPRFLIQKDHDTQCSCVGASSLPQLEEDYQRVIQALEEEMGRLRAETEKAEEEKMAVHKLNFELKKEVRSLGILSVFVCQSVSYALLNSVSTFNSFSVQKFGKKFTILFPISGCLSEVTAGESKE